MFAMPSPIAAYQLPDGTLVTSAEEYAARMSQSQATTRAQAYVTAKKAEFAKGQETRSFNIIKEFLMWEAGQQAVASQVQQAEAA